MSVFGFFCISMVHVNAHVIWSIERCEVVDKITEGHRIENPYLPMQKRWKIVPRISSEVTSPVMVPRW